ncbi:MAG: chorismate-binding protein, partial [Saprospiraceae bacterium]
MNPTKLTVSTRRLHADMMTPVTLYLSLRDHYTDPVLLESNESRENEHYYSFIGLETLGSFVVDSGTIRQNFPGGRATEEHTVSGPSDVTDSLAAYLHHYQLEGELPANFPFSNGLIGHANYESVQYFDTLEYDPARRPDRTPDLRYHLYRFIIAVHHFRDTLYILENRPAGEPSRLDEIEHHIWARQFAVHPFHITGEETSTMTDAAYRDLVSKGKHHCRRGDVFQIVLSRRFRQGFRGDEFQVYRALRSINPSPYLFFFDYGDYRIFGSSPEAQLVVRDGRARLNPIAGTYRRTGHAAADAAAARALLADPKENAEHIMLVDLARNDLSRHTAKVRVTELKDIHY